MAKPTGLSPHIGSEAAYIVSTDSPRSYLSNLRKRAVLYIPKIHTFAKITVMPIAECPNCGQCFHLQVRNIEKWLQERHPNIPDNEIPSELCINCWIDLKPLQKVYVIKTKKRTPTFSAEDVGLIINIKEDKMGTKIFEVQLSDNTVHEFRRDMITFARTLNPTS